MSQESVIELLYLHDNAGRAFFERVWLGNAACDEHGSHKCFKMYEYGPPNSAPCTCRVDDDGHDGCAPEKLGKHSVNTSSEFEGAKIV